MLIILHCFRVNSIEKTDYILPVAIAESLFQQIVECAVGKSRRTENKHRFILTYKLFSPVAQLVGLSLSCLSCKRKDSRVTIPKRMQGTSQFLTFDKQFPVIFFLCINPLKEP